MKYNLNEEQEKLSSKYRALRALKKKLKPAIGPIRMHSRFQQST
jgi:hypothetical protein